MSDNTLRITEIFYSLQGETTFTGLPTVFVRLTGCPLRCQYCDTEYAFHGGKKWRLQDIVSEVKHHNTRYVTVTGGEPLAQPACLALLKQLCNAGFSVSLETSGAIPVRDVDPRVVKIIDIKTPGSGEVKRNLYENLEYLAPHDQIKFVICNREDYEFSKNIVNEYRLHEQVEILFSPSYNQQNPQHLADWILEDRFPVRFQLQQHKLIWGDRPGV